AIVYLVAIFMIHKISGIIAVVGIVLLVFMAVWNELATKKIVQESTEENVRNTSYIDVASRNSEVLEAMGMIKQIVSEWSSKNDRNRALQMKAQSRSNIILGITKFIRSVLQISVIGVGAWLAINGHKTAGGIIASSILMGRALAPFEAAINTWKMLLSARISYRRLQTLLLLAPKREQSMTLPTPKGSVLFERVFFTPYGSNKPTIKGISFSVDPGSIVGIIGASASGKSTLAKLIVGVWKPISGVVRLDGADVYTWNREDFGKHVGYLPQDVELFNASVKTNIARMAPDPDSAKVIKAATIAGIHELILQLPNGYDTIIGSGGVVLSGGQKQMVGLARAFYGDVRLLVLDEPNANLDGKAEMKLIQALRYAKTQGITTFVVTHKVQLLNAVDQVLVMEDGMMNAMGSKEEILGKVSPSQNRMSTQANSGTAKSGPQSTPGIIAPIPVSKGEISSSGDAVRGVGTEQSGESAQAKDVASNKASTSTKSIDFGEGAQAKDVDSLKAAVPAKSAANTAAVNTDLDDTPIQAADVPKPLRKSASKARASKSNGEDTEQSGESAQAKDVASNKASTSTKSIDFGEGAQTKGVTSRKTAVSTKSVASTAAVNTDLDDTPIQAANAQKPLRRKKSHASEDKTVAAVRKKSVSKSEPVDKEN
ncbi:type I secretion system permease/ATPase, partial [Anaplasma bovis]|uniref:type I secretion system permease/ATPase n=1 Tax=Anaplasma bovis TaxID=186733 RepID=UPI002FF3654C